MRSPTSRGLPVRGLQVSGVPVNGSRVRLPHQISELENLPKDVSRSAYTLRILEIVGNIKKQKEEITKVRRSTANGGKNTMCCIFPRGPTVHT